MNVYPFPFIDDDDDTPSSGLLHAPPAFCQKAQKTKCAAHYASIKDTPGPSTCPFGFSTFVNHTREGVTVFSGLRIVGHEDRRNARLRLSPNEYVPRFSQQLVQDIIERARPAQNLLSGRLDLLQRIETLERLQKAQQDFSSLILHEVRKLNGQLKGQSEELLRLTSSESSQLKYRAENIFATSTLISVRLDAYDFETNPELATSGEKRTVGIYKKFEKSKHSLQVVSFAESKKINLEGQSYSQVKAYPVFDLLPYVLLDNALKYSPRDTEIRIHFSETSGTIVTVSSYGPILDNDETHAIFKRGYRGRHAASISGTGIGLYLAKRISDAHDFDLKVFPSTEQFRVGSVPYGLFRIQLRVPLDHTIGE